MLAIPVRFLRANAWLCFTLGYGFNVILVWLIANHTAEEMRPYRPILLLSVVTDFLYLTVYALQVPVVLIAEKYIATVGVGPLGWVPQPFSFALTEFYYLLFHFSLWSTCVPFIYRYAVICRRKEWGLRQFLAMLVGPAAACVGLVAVNLQVEQAYGFASPATNSSSNDQAKEAYELFFNTSHVDEPAYIFSSLPERERKDWVPMYAMPLIVANYSLVCGFGWKIYRHLKKKMKNLSEKRGYELNKQVSRALLLLAIVPLLMGMLPTILMGLVALRLPEMGAFTMYQTAVCAWTPVVNPLISIWVVLNYRREVYKWLCWVCRCGKVPSPTTTVVVMAVASQHRGLHTKASGREGNI